MKLNLGSGKRRVEGFLNVDIYPDTNPDFIATISHLPMIEDNSVEEIMCIHVIEHLHTWEVQDTLAEWYRVLQPGGKVAVECPDLDKCIHNYLTDPKHPERGLQGIFGDQKYNNPLMTHHWCYTVGELSDRLRRARFVRIRSEEALYHFPDRDLRVVGYK